MEKEQAKKILNSLIKRSVELQKIERDSPAFEKWKRDTRVAITNIFGPKTEHIKDFEKITFILRSSSLVTLEFEHQEAYVKGLQNSVAILESMIEEIDQYWPSSTPKTKATVPALSITIDPTKIFVVHGRNTKLRDAVFDFLRSISLKPIEWNQAIARTKKGSPDIGEILDAAFNEAQAVIVLLTGDDEARLSNELLRDDDPDYEQELTPQSRPNVLFESGMAMGRYPERTILIQIGEHRPFSDIAGKHITHMDNTPEKRQELATKLANAGSKVDTSGSSWFTAGDFQ
jgi:predicted nucleotide-binding protein